MTSPQARIFPLLFVLLWSTGSGGALLGLALAVWGVYLARQ